MAKLLFSHRSSRPARLLAPAFAIIASSVFFLTSCTLENDKRAVIGAAAESQPNTKQAAVTKKAAASKQAPASKPTIVANQAPAAKQQPLVLAHLSPIISPSQTPQVIRPAPKTAGPIILDDPGSAAFDASYKGRSAEQALPTLYLDKTGSSERPALTFAENSPSRPAGKLAENEVLTLDSNQIAFGGQLAGAIKIAANGDALRLLWIDEAGSVAAALDYAPVAGQDAGSFVFKMPPNAFGHLHKIALVRVPANGGKVKIEAVEPVRIVEGFFWDDYVVMSSNAAAQRLFPTNAARLEQALLPDENPLLVKNWGTQADAYAKSRDTKLFERKPSIFDEISMTKTRATVAKNVDNRGGGASLWTLGDGFEFSNHGLPFDYDTSVDTLGMFRDWLQDRYGSLKMLNTQWRTNYTEWEKVIPPTTDETKMALNPTYAKRMAILKAGDKDKVLDHRGDETAFFIAQKELHNPTNENLSAWADFRTFNDFAFGRVLREMKKFVSAKETTAQTGFINAQPPSAWGGWDYKNIVHSADWIEEHSSAVAREIMRGLAPPIHIVSASGGQDAASVHRLWDRWLRGDNGCLLPADATTAPFDDISEMTRGITLLRNEARTHVDPIAIYYSPRSLYVHWMLDSEVQGSTWLRRDLRDDAVHGTMNLQYKAWLLLLEDLGYAPYFIHPEDVVGGALHFPDTKVVILPKVISMSQNEAQALRDFVNAGGCVIADGQCGTFDGMGKRRGPIGTEAKPVGTMDADFGIQRKDFQVLERMGEFKGDPASSRLTLRGKDNRPVGAESPELRVLEPGVSNAGGAFHATSAGGGKAMFSSAAGNGHYFYLNLCLEDYVLLRGDKTAPAFKFNGMTEEAYAAKFGAPTGGEALRLAVSDILDEWVGENPLRVNWGTPSTPARNVKRARFDLDGGVTMFAVMPLADAGGDDIAKISGAPLDATIAATVGDGKAHCWYDMRHGEYLGSSDIVNVKIEPNRPALLSALPYVVEKVALKVRRLDQSRVFKITPELVVAGAMPGRHVFHFEVQDPTGKSLPNYSANVSADNGTCNHQITLGINEPAGSYHVKVRDVLTGKTAEGDMLKDGVEYKDLNFDARKN